MNANEQLSQITVPTPCQMDWNVMDGNDRVRFCASCGKHVYNLAAMTSDEAISLIQAQGGEMCGRFHRRQDGTVVTSDCQAQLQVRPRPLQFSLRSIMAVIAGFAALFSVTRLLQRDVPPPSPVPTTPWTTQIQGMLRCEPRSATQPTGGQQTCVPQ
jgi:hypothetical protein